MMPKRIKWVAFFAAIITLLAFAFHSTETEAVRVQRETEFAAYACRLIAQNKVWHSPRVAVAIALRKGDNPFYAQYWDGLARLKKLGVLQERSFQFLDAKGAPVRITPAKLFQTNDALWFVSDATNGVYVVTARPEALKPWEDLQSQYATNAAGAQHLETPAIK